MKECIQCHELHVTIQSHSASLERGMPADFNATEARVDRGLTPESLIDWKNIPSGLETACSIEERPVSEL